MILDGYKLLSAAELAPLRELSLKKEAPSYAPSNLTPAHYTKGEYLSSFREIPELFNKTPRLYFALDDDGTGEPTSLKLTLENIEAYLSDIGVTEIDFFENVGKIYNQKLERKVAIRLSNQLKHIDPNLSDAYTEILFTEWEKRIIDFISSHPPGENYEVRAFENKLFYDFRSQIGSPRRRETSLISYIKSFSLKQKTPEMFELTERLARYVSNIRACEHKNIRPKNTLICLSALPKDILECSDARPYIACLAPSNHQNPEKFNYVFEDIKAGSLIAYLIPRDDTEIKRPYGRMFLRPFINENGERIYINDHPVGARPYFFKNFGITFTLDQASSASNGTYQLDDSLYMERNARSYTLRAGKLLEFGEVVNSFNPRKLAFERTNRLNRIDL